MTTSPERQLKECKAYCDRRGWEVVGVANDLDSATRLAPWQRSQLSTWLDDRAPEFDNIVFWRLDRFVRKVGDLQIMIEWAKMHGAKALVSATEPFDLTDPSGEAMATMIASFARMEALAASERVTSMRQHLLTTPRWGGGSPPYGYRTYGQDKGRYLEINPATAPVVQEAARRVVSGESVNAICRDFEDRGVPSPADSYNKRKVERDFVWHPVTLKKILSSPALLGFKTRNEPVPGRKYQKKVLVHNESGQRVRMADPILTGECWGKLQSALAASATPHRKPESPRTPLLGVIKCGGCGKNLQLHVTKKKRKDGSERITSKIRCLSRAGSPACKGYVFAPEAEIIGPITQMLIAEIGEDPVTQRVYVQGDNSAEELAAIEESINYHVAQLMPGGIYSTGMLRQKGEQALTALQGDFERRKSLGEASQDHWEYSEVGMTFAERWRDKDITAITDDLVLAGITVECHPSQRGGHALRVPGDLRQRFAKALDDRSARGHRQGHLRSPSPLAHE